MRQLSLALIPFLAMRRDRGSRGPETTRTAVGASIERDGPFLLSSFSLPPLPFPFPLLSSRPRVPASAQSRGEECVGGEGGRGALSSFRPLSRRSLSLLPLCPSLLFPLISRLPPSQYALCARRRGGRMSDPGERERGPNNRG